MLCTTTIFSQEIIQSSLSLEETIDLHEDIWWNLQNSCAIFVSVYHVSWHYNMWKKTTHLTDWLCSLNPRGKLMHYFIPWLDWSVSVEYRKYWTDVHTEWKEEEVNECVCVCDRAGGSTLSSCCDLVFHLLIKRKACNDLHCWKNPLHAILS